jgi:hypothetical protein
MGELLKMPVRKETKVHKSICVEKSMWTKAEKLFPGRISLFLRESLRELVLSDKERKKERWT